MTADFMRRFTALLRKETRQMLRDKSNLAVGLFLPVVLILLFGYGLSFDVKNAPIAVVLEDNSPVARSVADGFQGSIYLVPIITTQMEQAEAYLASGEVAAIVRIPVNFSSQFAVGQGVIQLIVNGVESTLAASIEGYVNGAIGHWAQRKIDRQAGGGLGAGVEIVQRMWFNEANNSTWYLVPGLMVLLLTLIGAFLTSLLIAREWERGTLEALFVTPVRPTELVLTKLIPYLGVGAINLVLCLLASTLLFDVPMRGSLWIIIASSMLYLTVSLLFGLFISGVTRNQFQASQLALLVSFLPALMLSDFVFDLRNVPIVVQIVSQILPATHFMGLIKGLFLAGDHWPTIVRSVVILSAYAVVLFYATRRTLRKTLD